MADPRDELAYEAMANEPAWVPPREPLRIRVSPYDTPPPSETGWGGVGSGGRPTGRLFEPDQSLAPDPEPAPIPRPSMVDALRTQNPLADTRPGLPSLGESLQALPGKLGGLVQGASDYLSRPAPPPQPRPQVDPTAGPRGMWQGGYPSPQQPTLLQRGVTEGLNIPWRAVEESKGQFDPTSDYREENARRQRQVEGVTDVTSNLAGFGMTGASLRGGASAGIFGGRLAKGFDPNKEKLAQLMEQNGVPAPQIWKETGMVKFADGKWAHEISDVGAYYKGDVDSITKRIFDQKYPDRAGQYDANPLRMNIAKQDALLKLQGKEQLYLPDVWHHPTLFQRYPELLKMPVSEDALMNARGGYLPHSVVGTDVRPADIKYREEFQPGKMARGATFDTLLHEIQHAIQQIEGMARGGNPARKLALTPGTPANSIYQDMIKQIPPGLSASRIVQLKNAFASHAGHQAYQRSAGEELANVILQRKDMTPEQAAGVYPPSQFRTPMNEQIVEYNKIINPQGTVPQQMGGVLNPAPREMQMSAGPTPYARPPGRTMKEPAWQPVTPTPFLKEPQRTYSPGIYKNPKQIAEEAGAQTAAEHPALKELFGVTRDDLWQIGEKGARQGNVDPQLWAPNKPGGSYVARNIMTPENAQRMIDPMVEARRFPALSKGMEAWYVMDPAFQRMVQLVGKEQAIKDYKRFNAIMTPFSSNSTVTSEINRGTAARMMADRGRFDEFARLAGTPVEKRGADFPPELRDVLPHLRHGGHIPPVERWLKTGEHGYAKETVKNPLYTLASGVPETGFQTKLPVPDAHLARASGAADVRTGTDPKGWGAYLGGTEYREFGPWFRENVAKPLGVEAVPGQGLMWGTFAPQTGVKTAIGAPKLEILSQLIWERAKKLGIDPKKLRDDVLMGKEHAVGLLTAGAGGAAGIGSLVDPRNYEAQ